MIKEFQTVHSIAGPLMVVEGVAGVKYAELVEITLPNGEKRRGEVLEAEEDRALIQVFEGTSGIDVPRAKVRFLARGIELALAEDMLGRVFDGLGEPRDGGPRLIPEKRADINGAPINPYSRAYPNEFIQTGILGDPITRGDTMVVAGGGGAGNARSSDAIYPLGDAAACARFKDYPDTAAAALIRYAGNYKLTFFPVAFEAIDHSSRYLQRWTLIKRIFEWFGERLPGVEDQPLWHSRRPYTLHITPNPINRMATVEFTAPVTGTVELSLYTLTGTLKATQRKQVNFGDYVRMTLSALDLASGTYLVQLKTAAGVYAQKAVVLR